MPEAKKYQVFPEDPRDLVCGTCGARSPWMDSEATTADRARFKGWRAFAGPSLTGQPLKVVCCSGCFRTGAPARPSSAAVLEGQTELLGLLTPVPVEKKNKKTGKRQMS